LRWMALRLNVDFSLICCHFQGVFQSKTRPHESTTLLTF
jgi:hypothetical protein